MELQVGMKICEALLPCICCKVKSWTTPERSVIPLDQNSASVWNFWWNYTPLLHMISFSSFCFEIWLAFSHEPSCAHHHFFLFFWILLEPSLCPYFFNLFAQPGCLFLKLCQRDHIAWSFYVGGDGKHILAQSQCRNNYLFCGVYVSFDLGSMKHLSTRVTKLDQTQHKVRGICGRFCYE